MNDKKTNYFVSIINAIAIIMYIILIFTAPEIKLTIMEDYNEYVSIFADNIVEFFISNLKIIILVLGLCLSISNIINAIQNKTNKKLCFWQIIFAIIVLYWTITGIFEHERNWLILTLIFTIIPIMFAIKNLVYIKKDKASKIEIISYILVIISMIALLVISLYEDPYYLEYKLFDEVFIGQVLTSGWLIWLIVSIIMQFIYTHKQENQEVGEKKKLLNVYIHYIINGITAIVFGFLVLYSVISTKVNMPNWDKQVNEIYQNITNLQGSTIQEFYIPISNNGKYGFINENGQEKIACEYDRITMFLKLEKNNETFYTAFAQKGEDYYIISKENDIIKLNDTKQLENIMKGSNEISSQMIDFYEEKDVADVHLFTLQANVWMKGNLTIQPRKYEYPAQENIKLQKQGTAYYYNTDNYSMRIEPLEIFDVESGDNYTYCNITMNKNNDNQIYKESTYQEAIYGLDEERNEITLLSDGYIMFKSLDEKTGGWYNNNGDKVNISLKNFEISDVRSNKIILSKYIEKDEKIEYAIVDLEGNLILYTDTLYWFENTYWVKNAQNKMIMVDKNFNQISNEYDFIIFVQYTQK